MELWELTIKEAVEGIKKKKFSPKELVGVCYERIRRLNPKLNAFITVNKAVGIQTSINRDKDKKLHKQTAYASQICNFKANNNGSNSQLITELSRFRMLEEIAFGVKDIFVTKGLRTTAGSRVLENYIPEYEATVVGRLREAGAVIVGKTNLDAWAHGSSGENSDFGPTRNPWNLEYSPGGSSSGSAAAVSSGMCLAALGTDTGGSVRLPASFCNLVGLKPTYGRLSRYGVIAMASSLDCPGIFTKTVEDCEIVFRVVAGKDDYDATSVQKLKLKSEKLKVKIGLPKEYFAKGIDREVGEAVKKGVRRLEELDEVVEVKEVSLPHTEYGIATYYLLQTSEVSSNLARYDGIRYGYGRERFGDEAKRRIMLGTYALSAGYYEAYYKKAMQVRTLIKKDFARVFGEVDVLVAPVSPTAPFKLGEKIKDPLTMYLSDILTVSANLAGIPSLALPCGFTKSGLPIGMQIMGPMGSEKLLFKLGKAYQEVTVWHKRRPRI